MFWHEFVPVGVVAMLAVLALTILFRERAN
jgi:hypothetical protein